MKAVLLTRRRFCLCCACGAAFTATGGRLTPREAFAEARGIVSLIKDSAAISPIVTHACATISASSKARAETSRC